MQRITRNATAMLATGTGIGSVYKPDIEYVYNGSRPRVIKIVKPRDQVTKQVRPSNEWLYTYYVYDATGNVMAVYDRKTTTVDGHYRDAVGLAEQHIYGSNRLALMRPSSPVEWSYYYTPCGGEGEGSECRTIITSAVPGGAPTAAGRWLGYKEFELSNHLGNVIATVSDREVTELSATLDQFTGSTNGWGGAGVSGTGTQLQLNTTTAYADAMEKTITTVPGHSYRIRYTLINPNGLAVEGEAYPVPVVPPFLVNVPASVNTEFIFTATTTQTKLRIQRGVDAVGSSWFRIDDVWIEEVSGYAADLLMHTDYYAFGQQMPGRQWVASDYRYGMNGQEKQDELFKGANSAEYWMYDGRIGRRWELDPIVKPWESNYATFNNNPIYFADPLGLKGDGDGNKDKGSKPRQEGKGAATKQLDGTIVYHKKKEAQSSSNTKTLKPQDAPKADNTRVSKRDYIMKELNMKKTPSSDNAVVHFLKVMDARMNRMDQEYTSRKPVNTSFGGFTQYGDGPNSNEHMRGLPDFSDKGGNPGSLLVTLGNPLNEMKARLPKSEYRDITELMGTFLEGFQYSGVLNIDNTSTPSAKPQVSVTNASKVKDNLHNKTYIWLACWVVLEGKDTVWYNSVKNTPKNRASLNSAINKKNGVAILKLSDFEK